MEDSGAVAGWIGTGETLLPRILTVDEVIERCAAEGVNPGYRLGADYEEYEDGLLIAITEQRTREDIDRLARVLGAAVAAERQAVHA